ncbi:MAG: 6-phosphogluconolactonase [Blastocatellia bacterium]
MSTDQTQIVADAAVLAATAADYFVQAAQANIAEHGRLTVALSGGSTPKAMFALLATSPYREAVAWERVFIFWGDERAVPPDHADSNYRMTREALLAHVPLPAQNIFRIHGEAEPAQAAAAYAAQLRQFFQTAALPRFDLVFLGMGTDGHTASLFPGTSALHAGSDEIVVANYVEKLQSHRITLTSAAINQAHIIVFLVSGADKAVPLRAVREGAYQPELYPSQLIQPVDGNLLWLLDRAAAGDHPPV